MPNDALKFEGLANLYLFHILKVVSFRRFSKTKEFWIKSHDRLDFITKKKTFFF